MIGDASVCAEVRIERTEANAVHELTAGVAETTTPRFRQSRTAAPIRDCRNQQHKRYDSQGNRRTKRRYLTRTDPIDPQLQLARQKAH